MLRVKLYCLRLIINQNITKLYNYYIILMKLGNCVCLALKTFKNGKPSGLDGIPIDVWKTEALKEPLLDVCYKTFHGHKPDVWGKSGLKSLPKKGGLGITRNYRGISFDLIPSKIYNKMLLQRIRPYFKPILRMNQNGFHPKRSTLVQILTLRRLMKES